MSVVLKEYGHTADGTPVQLAILNNGQIEVHILSYAAAIQKLFVPDSKGRKVDVVLGFDDVAGYEANGGSLGSVVGRFANRIAGAHFYLNAEEYTVTANDNGNCLHSGLHGFDRTVFEMEQAPDVEDGVLLRAVSPDGQDGFPGTVTLEVLYSLVGSGLMIQYTATTDAPTVINITNHSYFNLNGHNAGSVLGHRLAMDANAYLETDAQLIPTGQIIPVAGTPMDFTEEKTIGRDIGADYPALHLGGGYDHCFTVPDAGLRHFAWLTGPETGIRMETLSTLPAVQVYTSNMLALDRPGKGGAVYDRRAAVCLETQDYPDAPNHMEFPDTTVTPKTAYSATTLYRFDIAPQSSCGEGGFQENHPDHRAAAACARQFGRRKPGHRPCRLPPRQGARGGSCPFPRDVEQRLPHLQPAGRRLAGRSAAGRRRICRRLRPPCR